MSSPSVAVYSAHYNFKLDKVLRAFAAGIPKAFNPRICDLRKPVKSDYAVIFGLVKKTYPPTHLKAPIIRDTPPDRLIVLESAFVLRKKYFAAGFGGIHGGADYRDAGKTTDRWDKMGIEVKPWQDRPDGPMLVCGQLPRDTNVQHMDHIAWCQDTVEYYRRRGVPVLFRPHPRMENPMDYGIPEPMLDTNKHIAATLAVARAVVTYNSTSGIDAMIHGVPVIAMGRDSMSSIIASKTLDPRELVFLDRTPLLARIGYAQWTIKEMVEGKAWEHLVGKLPGDK